MSVLWYLKLMMVSSQGRATLEARLAGMPALLVIDGVWQEEQLAALLVPMAPGSHVIITTRNRDLL